jgi:hypothetical protein
LGLCGAKNAGVGGNFFWPRDSVDSRRRNSRAIARGERRFACSAEKNRIRFFRARSTRCFAAVRGALAGPASEKKIKHGC